MDWTSQQASALTQVKHWYANRPKLWFTLGGYAGTGKSTLARHIAETIGATRVYFAAYTGKATHVLRKMGVGEVSTIHKLIYIPKGQSKVVIAQLQMELLSCKDSRRKREINAKLDNLCRPFFSLKVDSPLASADLVILDEYSMIDSQMGQDLLSFGCPVLALGDPGQLPPSFGNPFFTGDPDVMLTDVRRQAKDNPIIQLATMAREGTPIPMGNYGNSKVVRRGGNTEEVQGADQLLVGMNKSRAIGNRALRKLNKHPGDFPVKGEKLVCLRNNAEAGLYNGQLWYAEEDATLLDDCIAMSLIDDDGDKAAALAQIPPFLEQPPDRFTELDTFDFGYALTVHKSQGSQWDKVVLLDEWYGSHRNKWLYTGITRAAEQLTIIRG